MSSFMPVKARPFIREDFSTLNSVYAYFPLIYNTDNITLAFLHFIDILFEKTISTEHALGIWCN
jgi:hypothetical protein